MKVAILDPSLFGHLYDHFLCSHLRQQDLDVTLFSRKPRSGETNFQGVSYSVSFVFYHWSEKLLGIGWRRFGLFIKGLEHILGLFFLYFKFLKIKPDVIHYQWLCLPVIDLLFVKIFKTIAPCFVTVHDSKDYLLATSSGLQLYKMKECLMKFDHFIVHTEQAKENMLKHGFDAHQVFVVPHGAYSLLDVDKEPCSLPAKNEKWLLLFGILRKYKGVDLLVDAFSSLSVSEKRGWKLMLVGKADMNLKGLYRQISDRGCDESVFWDLGYASENKLHQYLSHCDALAFPYREIDASGAFFLSLSYNKPMLASDKGVFRENITHKKTGLLVKSGDLGSLRSGLIELFSSVEQNEFEPLEFVPDWSDSAILTKKIYVNALNQ